MTPDKDATTIDQGPASGPRLREEMDPLAARTAALQMTRESIGALKKPSFDVLMKALGEITPASQDASMMDERIVRNKQLKSVADAAGSAGGVKVVPHGPAGEGQKGWSCEAIKPKRDSGWTEAQSQDLTQAINVALDVAAMEENARRNQEKGAAKKANSPAAKIADVPKGGVEKPRESVIFSGAEKPKAGSADKPKTEHAKKVVATWEEKEPNFNEVMAALHTVPSGASTALKVYADYLEGQLTVVKEGGAWHVEAKGTSEKNTALAKVVNDKLGYKPKSSRPEVADEAQVLATTLIKINNATKDELEAISKKLMEGGYVTKKDGRYVAVTGALFGSQLALALNQRGDKLTIEASKTAIKAKEAKLPAREPKHRPAAEIAGLEKGITITKKLLHSTVKEEDQAPKVSRHKKGAGNTKLKAAKTDKTDGGKSDASSDKGKEADKKIPARPAVKLTYELAGVDLSKMDNATLLSRAKSLADESVVTVYELGSAFRVRVRPDLKAGRNTDGINDGAFTLKAAEVTEKMNDEVRRRISAEARKVNIETLKGSDLCRLAKVLYFMGLVKSNRKEFDNMDWALLPSEDGEENGLDGMFIEKINSRRATLEIEEKALMEAGIRTKKETLITKAQEILNSPDPDIRSLAKMLGEVGLVRFYENGDQWRVESVTGGEWAEKSAAFASELSLLREYEMEAAERQKKQAEMLEGLRNL